MSNSSKMDLSVVIRPVTMFVIFAGIGYVLNFSINVIMARLLSPEELGDFGLTLNLVFLLVPLLTIGCEQYILELLPKLPGKGNRWNVLVFVYFLIGFTSLVFFLIAQLIVSLSNSFFIGLDFMRAHKSFLFYWLVPLAALFMLQISQLQIFKQNFLAAVSRMILFSVFLLVCLIYTLVGVKPSSEQLLFDFATILILVTALQLYFIIKVNSKEKRHIAKIEIDISDVKKWTKKSSLMMLNSVMMYALASTDLIVYELLGKHENNLGILVVLFSSTSILFIIANAVNTGIAPLLNAYPDNSTKRRVLLIGLFMQFISLTSVGGLMSIFSKEILGLFGDKYVEFSELFRILVIIIVTSQYFKIFEAALQFGKQKKVLTYIKIVQLLFLSLSSVILVPLYDIYGSIIAVGISQIVVSILVLYFYVIPFFTKKDELI